MRSCVRATSASPRPIAVSARPRSKRRFMLLAEDGRLSVDEWRHLSDDEPIPAYGAITVSFARWQTDEAVLHLRADKLGLRLPNTIAPQEIAEDISRFSLII